MFSSSALMAKHGVKTVFSDANGGCSKPPFASLNLGLGLGDDASHVAENMQRLCEQSGMVMPHQAKQVHGVALLHCSAQGQMHDENADILLSNTTQVALAVRTADCLPILLADPKAKVIAAVHAGWRGTVAQVAQVAVRKMLDLGAKPERIVASFGACIGMCCFAVDAVVAQQLLACCGTKVSEQRGDTCYADLAQTNHHQLLSCGLLAQHIEMPAACSVCSTTPAYFSYRRDGGTTGRQLSIICME